MFIFIADAYTSIRTYISVNNIAIENNSLLNWPYAVMSYLLKKENERFKCVLYDDSDNDIVGKAFTNCFV